MGLHNMTVSDMTAVCTQIISLVYVCVYVCICIHTHIYIQAVNKATHVLIYVYIRRTR